MSIGNLGCVVIAVDQSEESMNALRWALQNVRLRSPVEGDPSVKPGGFVVLHVQPPPSIAVGLNPGAIPFGGPTHVEVPAITAAIEAHQRRITEAVLGHAVQISQGDSESMSISTQTPLIELTSTEYSRELLRPSLPVNFELFNRACHHHSSFPTKFT